MNTGAALFDTTNAPALAGPAGVGAISGGALRPGSIDQGAFLKQLQAQQAAREAAGVGGPAVTMPIPSFQSGIPNLTSAQFAALVGAQAPNVASGAPADEAADPQATGNPTAAAARIPSAQIETEATVAAAAPLNLSGLTTRPPQTASAVAAPAETVDSDAPSFSRSTAASPAAGTETAARDAGTVDPKPAADAQTATNTAAKTPSDPRVVHLKQPPDRDMQKDLRTQGKRWVVDETPGSRQLFFGADGVFGWDDFLDVINPLQHIPIVSQIYRAVTGDQINGAAELLGAIPFGPMGVIGMMGAIADLAVKDASGKDIGENLEAMVFGNGGATTPPAADAAATASGAGASDAQGAYQTASAGPAAQQAGFDSGAASLQHESCRG